jgi:hypothetical protein
LRHWRPDVKRNLANRVLALEAAVKAQRPAFRLVVCEEIYADDNEADEARKKQAAIDADRKKSGWDGDYAVIVPVGTHKRDGTRVPPGQIPRLQRKQGRVHSSRL